MNKFLKRFARCWKEARNPTYYKHHEFPEVTRRVIGIFSAITVDKNSWMTDNGYTDSVRRQLAVDIGKQLMDAGYLVFDAYDAPPDIYYQPKLNVRCSIDIVSKRV